MIFDELVGGELGVGFEQYFAGRGVDDVAGRQCAFEVRDIDFDFVIFAFWISFRTLGVILRPECAISSPTCS